MNPTNLLRIVLITLLFAFSICTAQLYAQTIPSENRVNWSVAGLWSSLPAQANAVFQINLMHGATWSDKVDTAITRARNWINQHPLNWAMVYFPAGTYTLSREVNLDQSNRNIVFQGAGANLTTLKFDMGGTNQNCFHIVGSDPETNKRELATNLIKGSTSIQCTATIGYSTPCWIRLCEEDHPYYDDWAQGSVGQIC